MPIDQAKYEKLKGILSSGGALSAEVRAQAEEAVRGFEAQLAKNIDPNLPVTPQVLATQPATTHAAGDQAASEEWHRGELANPSGLVVMYEPPVSHARQDMLAHPEIMPSLGYTRLPPSPETIQAMDGESPLYRAYSDLKWREAADAASKAGKTAYRYSRAPWMQGGGMSVLDTLGTKMKTSLIPTLEGVDSFVLGVDQLGYFGALKEAAKAVDAAAPLPGGNLPPAKDATEYRGGVYQTAAGLPEEQRDQVTEDMLAEENPVLHTAGQVVGAVPNAIGTGVKLAGKGLGVVAKGAGEALEAAGRGINRLAPWSASNALWDAVQGAGEGALKRLGVTGGVAPVATAAASAGVAGAASQAAQEGVDMATQYARTGETPTSGGLWDAAVRSAEAAPMAGLLGGGGQMLHQTLGGAANWVRETPRYGGVPGRLERAGVGFEFGKGPVTPAPIERARTRARAEDLDPVDVAAEEIAPKVAEGAKKVREEAGAKIDAENAEFAKTPEGKAKVAGRNLTETAVDILRKDMDAQAAGKVPRPVGHRGAGSEVKDVLNTELDGVSITPSPGAVALTPEEAQAFLTPERRAALRKQLLQQERPKGKETEARGGAARAAQAKPSGGVEAPAEVANVPAKRTPNTAAERKGASAAQREAMGLPARKAPEEPAPKVRVTGPGRAEREGAKPSRRGQLSHALRHAGHDTVYLQPRGHDAEHLESVLDKINGYPAASQNRDLRRLDKAARKDRDVRSRGGKEGGWSELKGDQAKRMKAAENVELRAAPQGDSHGPVAAYARRQKGEGPRARALRTAADKAGPEVRQQLEQVRLMGPLDELQNRISFGRVRGKELSPFSPANVGDAAVIRGAYPILRRLEGSRGPLTRTGRFGAVGEDDQAERRRRDRDTKDVESYTQSRSETIDKLNRRGGGGSGSTADAKTLERVRAMRKRKKEKAQ